MSEFSDWNNKVIEEFRANKGKVAGRYEGAPLLLLTTVGKKSGQPRVTPLVYVSDGTQLIIVASNMSASKHPDWYLNLVAHPQVTLEVGAGTFEAIATTLQGAERERLLEKWPEVNEHQTKTKREIPIVALQRLSN